MVELGPFVDVRDGMPLVSTVEDVDEVEDVDVDNVDAAAILTSLSTKWVRSVGGTLAISAVGFGLGFGDFVV